MERNNVDRVKQNSVPTEGIATDFLARLAARDPEGMTKLFAEKID